MTTAQKETLQKMRLAGKSYADICRVLGAKESTVRTYYGEITGLLPFIEVICDTTKGGI